MQKILCPKCKQIVMETDGKFILIRLQRPKDNIILPISQGPFRHASCNSWFNLHTHLTGFFESAILVLDKSNEAATTVSLEAR